MAKISLIAERLTKEHQDLHSIIPVLVSERGQEDAARELGVKQAWISRWLRENGYRRETKWIKSDEDPKSA